MSWNAYELNNGFNYNFSLNLKIHNVCEKKRLLVKVSAIISGTQTSLTRAINSPPLYENEGVITVYVIAHYNTASWARLI
jgi:hypothetical protein